jgi:hypothetical protein
MFMFFACCVLRYLPPVSRCVGLFVHFSVWEQSLGQSLLDAGMSGLEIEITKLSEGRTRRLGILHGIQSIQTEYSVSTDHLIPLYSLLYTGY